MTRAAKICTTPTRLLSSVAKSLPLSSKSTMSPTIAAATVVETTELAPTAGTATGIPAAAQPHVGNMTGHIYGKTARQLAQLKLQQFQFKKCKPNLQLQFSKFQLKEGNSRGSQECRE
jgi:hypothetical protein